MQCKCNIIALEKGQLERVVCTLSIIGCDLPSVSSIYARCIRCKTQKVIADYSHPASSLSSNPSPSGGDSRVEMQDILPQEQHISGGCSILELMNKPLQQQQLSKHQPTSTLNVGRSTKQKALSKQETIILCMSDCINVITGFAAIILHIFICFCVIFVCF